MNNNHCALSQMISSYVEPTLLDKIAHVEATGITQDSRNVTAGTVFVALNGANTDGRLYIDKAIAQGAVAVLCDLPQGLCKTIEYRGVIPIIYIANIEQSLSAIASEFFGWPQRAMKLIGITGTNGKTTVTQLVSQWLELLGHKTYSLGTLGNGLAGDLIESPNTTLNAIDLIANIARAKLFNVEYLIMEVSSHGLELGRVSTLDFEITAFTNLSQDHLDFHGDMASYAAAKKQLFSAEYTKHSILNGCDPTAIEWATHWDGKTSLSSFNEKLPHAANYLLASNVKYSARGINAIIESNTGHGHLSSKLLGKFNLDNLLTAINVLTVAGFELTTVLDLAPKIDAVAGRMDVFQQGGSPTIVVDYAHTPDALDKALMALRIHCDGELIVVFGCGGDRDNRKRILMTQSAIRYADKIVITQDNSRSEPFSQILAHMIDGIENQDNIQIEEDRTSAVKLALSHAKCGDIVLLAGKGHENYQILNNGRVNYDERALAKSLAGSY